MKITPERANDLARSLEFDCVDEGEKTEIAATLRWAVEVMRAEPKMLLGKETIIKPEPPEV